MDVIKPAEIECGQNRILVDRHTPAIAEGQQPAIVCWSVANQQSLL